MMKQASMLCGRDKVELRLPESAEILDVAPVPAEADPDGAVRRALAEPIGTPPLSEMAKGKRTACVVISDFTRPVPNKVVLPPLLQTLEESGVPRDGITILIATGMHRPNLGQELIDLIGEETAANYRVVNHYCQKDEELRLVAEIDGAPIEVNTYYLDAELKILTGLIEPHMYAGYSGGGKAVLPGVSSFQTMVFMHSYAMIGHPLVRNCVLEENPFHQAVIKVTEKVGADFIVNVVVNKNREPASVFAGHYDQAHLAGCAQVRSNSVLSLPARADLLVTSGGGFPLDATFYQVSKGLIIARDMLKKGGDILCLAGCVEGLGSPDFSRVIREGRSIEDFNRHYSKPENFVIDQWCVQTIYQAMEHAGKVYLYSPGLEARDVEGLGMVYVEDPQQALDQLLPGREKVIAVPEGPYVVGLAD